MLPLLWYDYNMHLLFIEPFLTPILFILIAVILLSGFFLMKSIYTKEKEFQAQESDVFSNYEKFLLTRTEKQNILFKMPRKRQANFPRKEMSLASISHKKLLMPIEKL